MQTSNPKKKSAVAPASNGQSTAATSAPQTTRQVLSNANTQADHVKGLTSITKGTKRLQIDNEEFDFANDVKIADAVSEDVQEVIKQDGTVVKREQFATEKLDQSIKTNLNSIEKGDRSVSRDVLLQWDMRLIQAFMDGFEPMPDGSKRSVSLEANGKLVVIRNFPLPDGYEPDYVDVMLDVTNYPAKPPIGMHLLERHNKWILLRINQNFGGHIYKDGYYGARSFSGFIWICIHYTGHRWSLNANDLCKGDNLSKLMEMFFSQICVQGEQR